jgi:hypothetical protein
MENGESTDPQWKLEKIALKQMKSGMHINFLQKCCDHEIVPKGLQLKLRINIGSSRKSSLQSSVDELLKKVSLDIMQRIIEEQKRNMAELSCDIEKTRNAITGRISHEKLFEIECDISEKTERNKEEIMSRHEKKFKILLSEQKSEGNSVCEENTRQRTSAPSRQRRRGNKSFKKHRPPRDCNRVTRDNDEIQQNQNSSEKKKNQNSSENNKDQNSSENKKNQNSNENNKNQYSSENKKTQNSSENKKNQNRSENNKNQNSSENKKNQNRSENKKNDNTHNNNIPNKSCYADNNRVTDSSSKNATAPGTKKTYSEAVQTGANFQYIELQQAVKNLTTILRAMAEGGTGGSSEWRTEMHGENLRRGHNKYRGGRRQY